MQGFTRIAERPNLNGFKVWSYDDSFGEFVYVWGKPDGQDVAIYKHCVFSDGDPVSEWYANDEAYKLYREAQESC